MARFRWSNANVLLATSERRVKTALQDTQEVEVSRNRLKNCSRNGVSETSGELLTIIERFHYLSL